MVIVAYLIPVIACFALGVLSRWHTEWLTYFWLILVGEGVTGSLHYYFYRNRTKVAEYLGSIVTCIEHVDEWTELRERKEQRTDSNGNTYTVTIIDEIYHPEEYRFHTSLGHHFKTNVNFFFHVFNKWNRPHRVRTIRGTHIKSGRRNVEYKYLSDEVIIGIEDAYKYIPISEKNYYTNKIINSNSVFNHERITREEARSIGLYEWPDIDSYYDVPAILSGDIVISDDIDWEYRRFNAMIASRRQMRLFVLLFPADRGIEVAMKQKAYWNGGNKNEFIVCLGVHGRTFVRWCYCFSWADENTVEVETAEWFSKHPELDLRRFLEWFKTEHLKWQRKEFKDFDYIQVRLELWQYLCIIGVGVVVCVLICALLCL